MNVYDTDGNILEEYDLSAGRLEPDTMTIHHDEVPEILPEISREVIWQDSSNPENKLYEEKIVNLGHPAIPAHDEEVNILKYIPFTDEELEAIEATAIEINPEPAPTVQEQLANLEDRQNAIMLGLAEVATMVSELNNKE